MITEITLNEQATINMVNQLAYDECLEMSTTTTRCYVEVFVPQEHVSLQPSHARKLGRWLIDAADRMEGK